MNYIYKLTCTTIENEDGTMQNTYGIEAYAPNASTPTRVISDIFTDKVEAERFISACNILALDIDHLDDVVYDVVNA